jgi:hypothetical protein
VAEQTIAGYTATSLDELIDILADLAASLDSSHDQTAADPFNEPAPALPRNITRDARHGRKPAHGS